MPRSPEKNLKIRENNRRGGERISDVLDDIQPYSIGNIIRTKERLKGGGKLTEDNIEGLLKSEKDEAMALLQEYSDLDSVKKKVFKKRIEGIESPDVVKRIEKRIDETLFIKRTTIEGVNNLKKFFEEIDKIPISLDKGVASVENLMPIRRPPYCDYSTIINLRMNLLKKEGMGIDPIVVFKHWSGRDILIDGHHRSVAAKILGKKKLPAYALRFSEKLFEPKMIEDCYKDKERRVPRTVEDIPIRLDKEKEKKIISFAEFKKLIEKESSEKGENPSRV